MLCLDGQDKSGILLTGLRQVALPLIFLGGGNCSFSVFMLQLKK